MDASERFPGAETEFLYVACWAARRCGWHDYAQALTDYALIENPDDARFWHAQALNSFAWIQRSGRRARTTLIHARECAERAIKLYEIEDSIGNAELIGANLHNVAYFATMNKRDPAFDVVLARKCIDKLKMVIPWNLWPSSYPEYHHGEALTEFREYEVLRRAKAPKSLLCDKLTWAQSAVGDAIRVYRKKTFVDLQVQIESARERLDCASSTL